MAVAPDGLLRQRGMFSLLGLDDAEVQRLRDEFAVYVVGGGRVNVAGLTARQSRTGLRRAGRRDREPPLVGRPPGRPRAHLGTRGLEYW